VGAIILGLIVSPVCLVFCSVIKNALKYDDSLDAFGIHGIGGIVGAIGTGIVYAPSLGGPGDGSVAMGAQLVVQIEAVLATVVWAGVGTAVAIFAAKALTGLRVSPDVEREGLDLGEHGERAYNS
jgi:Amt family ammonium transporter